MTTSLGFIETQLKKKLIKCVLLNLGQGTREDKYGAQIQSLGGYKKVMVTTTGGCILQILGDDSNKTDCDSGGSLWLGLLISFELFLSLLLGKFTIKSRKQNKNLCPRTNLFLR